jgi:hypothetical protein
MVFTSSTDSDMEHGLDAGLLPGDEAQPHQTSASAAGLQSHSETTCEEGPAAQPHAPFPSGNMKQCSRCKVTKLVAEFTRQPAGAVSRLFSTCRACRFVDKPACGQLPQYAHEKERCSDCKAVKFDRSPNHPTPHCRDCNRRCREQRLLLPSDGGRVCRKGL